MKLCFRLILRGATRLNNALLNGDTKCNLLAHDEITKLEGELVWWVVTPSYSALNAFVVKYNVADLLEVTPQRMLEYLEAVDADGVDLTIDEQGCVLETWGDGEFSVDSWHGAVKQAEELLSRIKP